MAGIKKAKIDGWDGEIALVVLGDESKKFFTAECTSDWIVADSIVEAAEGKIFPVVEVHENNWNPQGQLPIGSQMVFGRFGEGMGPIIKQAIQRVNAVFSHDHIAPAKHQLF